FLVENGYAQNVSVKSLQTPSTKDFCRIFAFIYVFCALLMNFLILKLKRRSQKSLKNL
ncbi:unnamed protein product, partial [Caretta caretta]